MVHRLLNLGGKTIMVTNPDFRLDGGEGPTKADVVAYYATVAPRMLPFLCGRPTSTLWLPDDSTQEFRFLRTAPAGCLGRFPTCRVARVGSPRTDPYLTVPDEDTLAALVNHGCLSFHPWNCTAAASRRPSQLIFNLDPEAIAFREVRNAALLLRELLGACGLAAWVKTSGQQGLHVLVPLDGSVSFEDVRLVAETMVTRAIRREPTLFSRDLRAARRRGRILIDISRNDRGATVIAPYAVATSGLVSELLDWDELRRPLYPEDFDMARVVTRDGGDLRNQAAFFAAEQSLEAVVPRRRRRSTAHGVPLGDTPAALADQARWLGAESRRLRDDAEVTRIESADVRCRARKVVEERRRLSSGPS